MSDRARHVRPRGVLSAMRRFGKQGLYRAAIRAFLSIPFKPDRPHRLRRTDAEIQLQYAIALQHAGLFGLARTVYETIEMQTRGAAASSPAADIHYNACVQLAVLRERFGDPIGALKLLEELGSPRQRRDLELARASLQSWISITRMKSLLTLKRRPELLRVATNLERRGDWNERLWGTLFLSLLVPRGASVQRQAEAIDRIRTSIDSILQQDLGGAPWTALLVGKHASDKELAREFLVLAHTHATRLGKFFVIGEATELLSQHKEISRHERERYLRRAITAYARCGLLLHSPFRQRLFRAAASFWNKRDAQQAIMQSAHLLELREDLVFSKMCARLAREGRFGNKPAFVFEEFVRDWAMARYPGRYRHIERAQSTADVLIIQRRGGVVLQAKHVASTGKHIPQHLNFRKLFAVYKVRPKRYVLVISTSRREGWTEDMWHAEWTEKVLNLAERFNVAMEVVLEPELQTDVLLNDDLFDKYFGANQDHGR